MNSKDRSELYNYVEGICAATKAAAFSIAQAGTQRKNAVLKRIAQLIIDKTADILEANEKDIQNAGQNGVPVTMIDRLRLNEERLAAISASLVELCGLPDPIGSGERWVRPNGLGISCVRVPIGVIAIIYEARPNVTVDAAALCIKTGNAVVLRGGKEALNTNTVLVSVMREALAAEGINPDVLSFIDRTEREGANILMSMRQHIDVLIPRGGAGLIRAVVENAKMPVIETGAGNCHLYVDEFADIEMAVRVAQNAKVSRPSVCNAIETLLVHSAAADAFLPKFADSVAPYNVEIRGCRRTCAIIPEAKTADETDYATEYNDYILAVRIVDSIDEAISHINKYNTKHSDGIITASLDNAQKFKQEVDAAAVYVNASTRFTDGGEFGFGAEIGISTQKLHARGPMGLRALTTEKYLIDGSGQIR
ncbi:MAG: glutamate-5-semialdehyde dehydrogenase [Clostridiales bacterium]|nr:glutamate-5-semialdehyde dehydrogenase [Clostridiales bacterium]